MNTNEKAEAFLVVKYQLFLELIFHPYLKKSAVFCKNIGK